jgi:2-polyprenyl-3-methyl-5-hydroxy-6-metoxy-1,4-benzoquinol methylase
MKAQMSTTALPLHTPRELGESLDYVPYNDRPHRAHEKLLALVGPADRVLDVGCSTGYLAQRLSGRGAAVVGIELDEQAAEEARRVCEQVLVGDVEAMEFPFEPESFDVVLCGDLVEHLRAPGAWLERVRPLIRSGGRLVLTTPNVANWSIRASLLLGRWRYTERGILDRTHAHLFTRRTLTETLEVAGFRVLKLDYTVPVPLLGARPVEAFAHAVARVRPSFFAYQFVVAATPAD